MTALSRRRGLLVGLAAVLCGVATAIVLKQFGVYYAFAEGIGFLVGSLTGWFWVKHAETVTDTGRPRFSTWAAWCTAAALVGFVVRISL